MSIKTFLVIGCGAREHAIIKSLLQEQNNLIICIGNFYNSEIANSCNKYIVHDLNDHNFIKNLCSNKKISFVIIGPEVPLANGLVDTLNNITNCLGPTKNLSLIESSKIFARELLTQSKLNKYNPYYVVIDYPKNSDLKLLNKINIRNILDKYDNQVVIKASGLHGGKGVKVFGKQMHTRCDILNYIDKILENKESLLIEEKLVGYEFSLISITDGKSCKHFPPVMDFKPLLNNNEGPNTGSMGCIMDKLHYLNDKDIKEAQKVNELVIEKLQKKVSQEYNGFLYGSFIKTEDGIKVIEFNCRLGDPEAIVLLNSMKTTMLEICESVANKELNKLNLEFNSKKAICKYIVPNGYPKKKNTSLLDLSNVKKDNLFFGSLTNVRVLDNNNKHFYKMLGSRTIAVCKTFDNDTFINKEKEIDNIILKMKGDIHYRTDLAKMYSKTRKDMYTECGVNIEEANKMVSNIQTLIKSTYNVNVLNNESSFGGMYSLPLGYRSPVLVSSTDGVGTKSILVKKYYGKEGYQIIGQDLVNHCINDILVQGAHPLFFLDYFASSKLDNKSLQYFIKGVTHSCKKSGCVLIGGETAEMPGVYNEGQDDVVGTIVGLVEKDKIINGKKNIKEDNIVIGLPSSGPHTNGYSLIRNLDIVDKRLCNVHKCYLDDISKLRNNRVKINGLVHITGGGLIDNPPRVIPDGLEIEYTNFEMSDLFKKIQKAGNISDYEMKKVFNCGVGMLIITDVNYKEQVLDLLEESFEVGKIVKMT